MQRRLGEHPGLAGLGAAFAVLALYVLSFGPMLKLVHHSRRPSLASRTFRTVYSPLLRLERHRSPVGRALYAYADWWQPQIIWW